ncbi:MAG: heparinase [Rhodospirillales bacterium]|jgi:uncharacterized heparinase superfamily protein|nr:heparinase [Rhodospirillales bacterium]
MLKGLLRGFAKLRPVRAPEAPSRPFRDLWPGDAARGGRLLRGEFEHAGSVHPLLPSDEAGAPPIGWGEHDGAPPWRAAIHSFIWLRDLRTLGSDAARIRARALAADWLAIGHGPLASAPEVVGARISSWLGNWDFFAATAEDDFRRAIMQRLATDARDLIAALPAEAAHRGALVALKGALAAAVALDDDAFLQRCVRFLPPELERQFHPDGGHIERSPAQQMEALKDLIEIRNLLHGVEIEAPPHLTVALDRAAPALRSLRHGDGGLALFNGTRDENSAMVDLVLTQGQARSRAPLVLAETGFQRLQAGRTLVIVDCGAPPSQRAGATGPGGIARGADRLAHAGTLAFEMSVGRERMIVNCGAAPAADPAWRDALRATAAHSTLTLSDTNSAELRDSGLGRRPEHVEAERQEASGGQLLELSHDGYVRAFGAIHRRRLYLSESGDDLRGHDRVEMAEGKPLPGFAVRFHLHPGVTASAQQDETAILLRLPSGIGWRLRANGARVAIEESVHLGGDARKSQQIALFATGDTGLVQWAISRVSLPAP